MNLNLYGHDDSWLMVDCGITFDAPLNPNLPIGLDNATGGMSNPKFDVVCADPTFISQRKQDLCGIIITHAHEDHIGALARLWPRFKAEIYTTPFTAEILRRKLRRDGGKANPVIHIVEENRWCHIGPFQVQWIAMNHSLPEPYGLLINTTAGQLFHSADWKLDKKPVLGKPLNTHKLKEIGRCNLLATVCDSTNALQPGYSLSEHECYLGLKHHVEQAKGRVAIACFSTNIARLISMAKIAQETGRYFAVLGRALENTLGAARLTGHWPDDLAVQDPLTVGYLPPEEVLVAVTGSQGEERATLARMANDSFRQMDLVQGDTVIFSAIVIPDNEELIQRLVDKLTAKKIQVIQSESSEYPVHASGHPNEEELRDFYHCLRPQIAIPTHGEQKHMARNAEIAAQCHVPVQLTGLNGDLFVMAPEPRVLQGFARTGRIPLTE